MMYDSSIIGGSSGRSITSYSASRHHLRHPFFRQQFLVHRRRSMGIHRRCRPLPLGFFLGGEVGLVGLGGVMGCFGGLFDVHGVTNEVCLDGRLCGGRGGESSVEAVEGSCSKGGWGGGGG